MFRCAQFAALSAVLLASVGCAHWTLRPQTEIPAQVDGGRHSTAAAINPAGQRGIDASAPNGGHAPAAAGAASPDVLPSNIKNLDPFLSIARLAERQGDPGQARMLYLRYIEKNPEHPLPHHRLGVMAAREAKYDQAQEHFARAMQLSPPSVELLSDLGYCYYLLSRLDDAERVLRQGAAAEPANAMVNNNLALVLAAKGDFAESAQAFRRVNEEGQARANQAYALSQNGRLEQAREEYLTALTIDNTLTTAAKALLQVDKAYQMKQQNMAQADEPAQDRSLSAQSQPTNSPAGYAQYVAPVSLDAPSVPPSQAARQTVASPQTGPMQARDIAPRGNDMAAMLMPVPSASQLPPPRAPREMQQQSKQTSGIGISLSDEPTAGGQSTSMSLSDSP